MTSKYVCDASGGEGCWREKQPDKRKGLLLSMGWKVPELSGEGGLRAGSGVLGPGRQMGLSGDLAEGRGRAWRAGGGSWRREDGL